MNPGRAVPRETGDRSGRGRRLMTGTAAKLEGKETSQGGQCLLGWILRCLNQRLTARHGFRPNIRRLFQGAFQGIRSRELSRVCRCCGERAWRSQINRRERGLMTAALDFHSASGFWPATNPALTSSKTVIGLTSKTLSVLRTENNSHCVRSVNDPAGAQTAQPQCIDQIVAVN